MAHSIPAAVRAGIVARSPSNSCFGTIRGSGHVLQGAAPSAGKKTPGGLDLSPPGPSPGLPGEEVDRQPAVDEPARVAVEHRAPSLVLRDGDGGLFGRLVAAGIARLVGHGVHAAAARARLRSARSRNVPIVGHRTVAWMSFGWSPSPKTVVGLVARDRDQPDGRIRIALVRDTLIGCR